MEVWLLCSVSRSRRVLTELPLHTAEQGREQGWAGSIKLGERSDREKGNDSETIT